MNKIFYLALVFFVFSVSAFGDSFYWRAHYWHGYWPRCRNYPENVSTVVGQTVDHITGTCIAVPLKLGRTQKEALTVDAWIGGYDRNVTLITTYQIDHYDRCSGNWLWVEDKQGTTQETLHFNVINPNLAADLPSYVSNAPMLDQEAQAALPEALSRCRSLHLGPWPQ